MGEMMGEDMILLQEYVQNSSEDDFAIQRIGHLKYSK
jgi:hypothetical protein